MCDRANSTGWLLLAAEMDCCGRHRPWFVALSLVGYDVAAQTLDGRWLPHLLDGDMFVRRHGKKNPKRLIEFVSLAFFFVSLSVFILVTAFFDDITSTWRFVFLCITASCCSL